MTVESAAVAVAPPGDVAAALRRCVELTRGRAKNFYYAFWLLPRDTHEALCALYAFCSEADADVDAAPALKDAAGSPSGIDAGEAGRRLARTRAKLEAALAGRPDGDVFIALADVVRRFGVDPAHLRALLDGMAMDLARRRYATWDDLRTYCYHAASVVGLAVLEILGARTPAAREAGTDLGVAMQLTNILRDVREDAGRGRIYLPKEDLDRFGVTEAALLAGTPEPGFAALVRFEADRAEGLFARGRAVAGELSPRAARCPAVLAGVYGALLAKIAADPWRVLQGRIQLSPLRKVWIAWRAR